MAEKVQLARATLISPSVGRILKSQLVAFALLVIVLVGCFVLGGSARGDVASLIVLRPVVAVALTGGLLCLDAQDIRANRVLLAFSAAIAALPLLFLIPLPPEIWTRLPGRELVAEIDRAAGLGSLWRPLTLAPDATWNAFYAGLVFLTVVVLGVHLREGQRQLLLTAILALGGCSIAVGLLQAAGSPESPLYFYQVTNNGAQVGLFANRNHHALLVAMMLPMLWVVAVQLLRGGPRQRVLGLAAIASGVALLPLLLLIGSRGGLLCGAAALLSLPFLVGAGPPRPRHAATTVAERLRHRAPLLAAGGLATVGGVVLLLTVSWGQGFALDRLLSQAIAEDMRWRMLPTVAGMAVRYWPVGSGVGTFEKAFKVSEPDALLGPEYVNHAHNDWLELLVTTGVFGLVMLAIAAFALVAQGRRAWSGPGPTGNEVRRARLGIVLIGLAAFASLGDYPLRVPSLAAVFAVAVIWAGCPFALRGPMTEPEKP